MLVYTVTPRRIDLLYVLLSSAQLSSQLELQIIPIEQNILCSLFSFAMAVVGTLGKMSALILVVRCLVISLKSQMLNTNIKS